MKKESKPVSSAEYAEFRSAHASVPAPSALLERVHRDLNPSLTHLLTKISLIHIVSALVTLSVCPQFGFRLIGEGHGLMHYFMALGSAGCPLACGVFFLGTSFSLSAFVMNRDELRKLRESRLLILTVLVLASLGFFKVMDGEFFLEFSLFWIVGAFLGGWLTLEGVWRVRRFAPTSVN